MVIIARGSHIFQEFKYFDLLNILSQLLMTPNICAKFEPNRSFELYHSLPGALMDTLLSMQKCINFLYRLSRSLSSRLAAPLIPPLVPFLCLPRRQCSHLQYDLIHCTQPIDRKLL